MKQLMRDFGIGGRAWVAQFAVGFPITGRLSQRHLLPPDKKIGKLIPSSQLFDSAGARFRERAAQSGRKNAHQSRGEAMCQIQAAGSYPHLNWPQMAAR